MNLSVSVPSPRERSFPLSPTKMTPFSVPSPALLHCKRHSQHLHQAPWAFRAGGIHHTNVLLPEAYYHVQQTQSESKKQAEMFPERWVKNFPGYVWGQSALRR